MLPENISTSPTWSTTALVDPVGAQGQRGSRTRLREVVRTADGLNMGPSARTVRGAAIDGTQRMTTSASPYVL